MSTGAITARALEPLAISGRSSATPGCSPRLINRSVAGQFSGRNSEGSSIMGGSEEVISKVLISHPAGPLRCQVSAIRLP